MNNYESVIILSNSISDEAKVAFAEKLKELILANGELLNVDEWGKKTLAYEIKKQKEGFYIVFTYKTVSDAIKEIERVLSIDETVIKFITIKK
jgi:small subunit ribosomal protein S6